MGQAADGPHQHQQGEDGEEDHADGDGGADAVGAGEDEAGDQGRADGGQHRAFLADLGGAVGDGGGDAGVNEHTAEPCAADDLDDGRSVGERRLGEGLFDDVEGFAYAERDAEEVDQRPDDGEDEESDGEIAALHRVDNEADERGDQQQAHDPDDHDAPP